MTPAEILRAVAAWDEARRELFEETAGRIQFDRLNPPWVSREDSERRAFELMGGRIPPKQEVLL